MEAIYHIYGYLKHHNHSTMDFDDAIINWKDTDFTAFEPEGHIPESFYT
jgi:hypothetical protein